MVLPGGMIPAFQSVKPRANTKARRSHLRNAESLEELNSQRHLRAARKLAASIIPTIASHDHRAARREQPDQRINESASLRLGGNRLGAPTGTAQATGERLDAGKERPAAATLRRALRQRGETTDSWRECAADDVWNVPCESVNDAHRGIERISATFVQRVRGTERTLGNAARASSGGRRGVVPQERDDRGGKKHRRVHVATLEGCPERAT